MDRRTEEHIRNIVQEIKARRCIFFLGAGISIEAGLPSGADLSEMLARKRGWKYNRESLPEVAERYAAIGGPVKPVIQEYLKTWLRERSIVPQKSHCALAFMAENIDVILTTNWDRLLEDAFESVKIRDYMRIFRDAHMIPPRPEKTAIIKLHGDIDDADSLIVKKEDYKTFQKRSPGLSNALQNYLRTYTLVIIGYEQADENFQRIYGEVLEEHRPATERSLVYVVNPKEDLGWEQVLRDKAQQRFLQMGATEFLTQVYEQVRTIADRKPELQVGEQLVPYPCRKPIIEFFGVPGIGKSALLKAVQDDYENSKDVYTARIDFTNSDFCEDSNAGYRVIWDELNTQLGMRARYADSNEWINLLKRKGIIVFFFDAAERAPHGTIVWLGTLLKTLTDALPELRAIFACRYPRLSKGWSFQIKSRLESRRLEPFSRTEDVRRQMGWYFLQDNGLAQFVFDLTQGHPGLAQKAIDWLLQHKINKLGDMEAAVQNELCDQARGWIDEYILDQVPIDLRVLLHRLAYYREFGYDEVRFALSQTGIHHAETHDDLSDFIRGRLNPTGLLDERARNNLPFAIDPTVRRLLVNLDWFHDTQNFVASHAAIAKQRARYVERLDANWYLHVIEYLYHTLQQMRGEQRIGQSIDIPQALTKCLAALIQTVTDKEKLERLERALEEDEELGLLGESIHLDLPTRLGQLVKTHRNALKG